MNDLYTLVYSEGFQAFEDNVSCIDCPYDGVSKQFESYWLDGWFDAFLTVE